MFKLKTLFLTSIFLGSGLGIIKIYSEYKSKNKTDYLYNDEKIEKYFNLNLRTYFDEIYLKSLRSNGNHKYKNIFDLHKINQEELKSEVIKSKLSHSIKDKYIKLIAKSNMPTFKKIN